MIISLLIICVYLVGAHYISYILLKNKVVNQRHWGLNICCGETDGGGINVDIVKHSDVPQFHKINNIYNLPFKDKEFKTVLCSHTIEHVDDPERFFEELKRVGEEVTLVVPPLWDIGAALNFFEHKRIFLTWKKKHNRLPKYIDLPFSSFVHETVGQIIKS